MASDKMEVVEFSRQPQFHKSNLSAQPPPIPALMGEHPLLLGKTGDNGSALVTNFRLCVCEQRAFITVPLMAIGELTVVDTAKRLKIGCKDGATFLCSFASIEDCRQFAELLKEKSRIPRQLADIFAYRFYFHAQKKELDGANLSTTEKEQMELCQRLPEEIAYSFGKEVERLGFDCSKRKIWKMSQANENFEFCPTYPKYHILPATVENDILKKSTDFRAGKRFPSVVWRDRTSGVVLIRSSQPLPSFLGLSYYSNEADVFLLDEIVKACNREKQVLSESKTSAGTTTANSMDRKSIEGKGQGQGMTALEEAAAEPASSAASVKEWPVSRLAQSSPTSGRRALTVNGHTECSGASPHVDAMAATHQLAIVDCRSLAMVWGNSLKGGGTEDENLYKCNIIHLDLANIHTVRDSFSKLRNVCHSYQDGSYYKALSGSMWLNYISCLLKGANTVVRLMHVDKRPVLVHCSDGWDRTAQIVSLSELMMDPYYRTIEGFQVLVEREWLAFGHKFGERGGHDPSCSDISQQSPIFLQFLDCVYQLTLQYPASFQFNEAYLVKLLKHSQACLFGNFLHNCDRERERCPHKMASVWSLLRSDNPQFLNLLYKDIKQVLTAQCGEHEVVLWTSVYMAGQSPSPQGSPKDFSVAFVTGAEEGEDGGVNEGFSRSRSMDDLSKASIGCGRRNSDPNLAQTCELAAANSMAAPASAPIHDTSSSSAELLHFSDSPASYGFHSEASSGSPSDFHSATVTATNGGRAEGVVDYTSSSEPSPTLMPPSTDVDKMVTPKKGEDSCETNGHIPGGGGVGMEKELNSTDELSIDPATSEGSKNDISNCLTADTQTQNGDGISMTTPLKGGESPARSVVNGSSSDRCNGVAGNDDDSFSSSHSSSYFSVPEDKLTSLLSERLANCPKDAADQQTTTSAAPFHHSSVSRSSPDLNGASPSSEDKKIVALKQAQQELLIQQKSNHHLHQRLSPKSNHLSKSSSPSSSSSSSQSQSHRDSTMTKWSTSPLQHSQREMNGHHAATTTGASEDGALPYSNCHGNGGGLNSKSTDTLVGDVEEVVCTPAPHHTDHQISLTSPLDINVAAGVDHAPVRAALPTSASASRLRCANGGGGGSPSGGNGATAPGVSRRARTGSGASIDSSLSPCVCRGHWSDTGRLRHPSGGDSTVRRWIGSSVSTSTSDISDSCVGKVSPPVSERQAGVRQVLDVDGLALFADVRHQLLADLVWEKDSRISNLEARLSQALAAIRATRSNNNQQPQAATVDDLLLTDSEGGEYSSLGAHSNAASDASWEQVQESEERIALWMPDDAVTHCAGCDKSFWFALRKHHCRNCGKIFCADCSGFLAPVASIYQKELQRVCGRCHSRLMQLSPGASCDGRIPTMVADG